MNNTLKGAIVGAVISGLFGVAAAFIAKSDGKSEGQQLILDEINSQIAIVNSNNNTVTINNVNELVDSYISLKEKNNLLENKNTSYFNDITKLKEQVSNNEKEIQSLKSQLSASPIISFSNVGLSVDGDDIPINMNNAMATINGEDYFTKEIVNCLIPKNKNLTIKNNTVFIGKVISQKANLSDQWVLESSNVDVRQGTVDSYGNTHANSLYLINKSFIIYNLNKEYSLLKFNLSMSQSSHLNNTCILTIKADGNVVYTSPELTKTLEPYAEIDIPINNCSLLTIEYGGSWNNDCILSNVEVYN